MRMSDGFACLGTTSRPVAALEQKQLRVSDDDADEATELVYLCLKKMVYFVWLKNVRVDGLLGFLKPKAAFSWPYFRPERPSRSFQLTCRIRAKSAPPVSPASRILGRQINLKTGLTSGS